MSAPYWQLAAPYWELASLRAEHHPPIKQTKTIYRTVLPSPELLERAAASGAATLDMTFALFNVWTEINNSLEGHFLERLAPGVFRKSIRENLANIRAILSHGKDPSLGSTVLGKIQSIDETPHSAVARVSLFPSVPQLLLDGLEAGQYGSSFRGEPIKNHYEHRPPRSDYNPDGLPEVTRQEIRLRDIGPTPFAAYAGTTAKIQEGGGGLVPRSRQPEETLTRETAPYWELSGDVEPSWQLQRRKEHRGRTYATKN